MSLHIEALKASAPYKFIAESFYTFYIKEFGELNTKEIIKKVIDSNGANKFLMETSRRGLRPMAKNYIEVVNSSRSFLFAKAEKVAFASIFLLERWNNEVGEKLGLSNDLYLNRVFFEILFACDGFKTHISGNPNFFARYYTFLEEVLQPDNEQIDLNSTDTEQDEYISSRAESRKVPLLPKKYIDSFNSITVREAIYTGQLFNIGFHGFYAFNGNEVVGGKSNEFYFPLDDFAIRVSKKLGEKLENCGDDPDFIFDALFLTSTDHYEFGDSKDGWFYLYHPEIDKEEDSSKFSSAIDDSDDLPF